MKDPFELLGVERDATKREIKAAYRKLAKELHPDLHPDNEMLAERFKEISAAYETLSNDSLRKRYSEARARGTWGAGFAFGEMPDHEPDRDELFSAGDRETDLHGDIAGHRRGRGGTSMWLKGEDLFHEIKVSFLDAARGVRREVTLPTSVTLDIEIPPATEDGAILSFPGWGFPGYGGGEPGNLNMQVRVEPHPILRRSGHDILVDVEISARQAEAGGFVSVPTLTGEQRLRFHKGARNGDVLHIKGAGLRTSPEGPRGDQHVTLRIRS